MAVFKCKMCGGELNFIEDTTVCECEYCGTTQTVPSADNEKKMNLFNRANRLRFANEFDKAAGVFESIVAEFPEEAEAYWGLVLCKYGIEYVDDPETAKKMPTCHRTSYDGIFEDNNFQMSLEYADPIANRVYREEAKKIDKLQKAILEVAEKEEPFDVFICYKETAEDGQRTKDSVLAEDMYDALTAKGYKVFFSRITLEDKLGQEYEPYIFAALNSAKVMLAVGTKYEYFNAVWVKNEWARFLELIKKDKNKVLIPCYYDIDAYDMPAEFKNLQGQDMNKVGFIQDLVRGIGKIILPKKVDDNYFETVQIINNSIGPNVDSLLERAKMLLEDGDFHSANEYCDKVLDIEPKNAEAYLYKTCAHYLKCTPEDLINEEDNFEEYSSFIKAKKFADSNIEEYLNSLIAKAEKRRTEVKEQRLTEEKAKEEKVEALKQIRSTLNTLGPLLSFCDTHIVGLKSDGSVVEASRYDDSEWDDGEWDDGEWDDGEWDDFAWTDIVAIACERSSHTVGLKSDGTVVATGDNNHGQCNVSEWTDIVSIACSLNHTVGLKADGTVVATGDNNHGQCNVSGWTDIVSIACSFDHTVGLKADGGVFATGLKNYGQCKVTEWADIVSIACGLNHTVGLKADGTVVATGSNNHGECNVSRWTDIVSIACDWTTVGLKADGTVVATGNNDYGKCNVSGWTDIVAIACEDSDIVGLKSDGTVVATRDYKVSGWTDIVAIACKGSDIVGLKSDGTVVKASRYDDGECGVSAWKLFENIDQLIEMEKKKVECTEKIKKRVEEFQKLASERRVKGVCQHCGGEFKGMLIKKCTRCGKGKDY